MAEFEIESNWIILFSFFSLRELEIRNRLSCGGKMKGVERV